MKISPYSTRNHWRSYMPTSRTFLILAILPRHVTLEIKHWVRHERLIVIFVNLRWGSDILIRQYNNSTLSCNSMWKLFWAKPRQENTCFIFISLRLKANASTVISQLEKFACRNSHVYISDNRWQALVFNDTSCRMNCQYEISSRFAIVSISPLWPWQERIKISR